MGSCRVWWGLVGTRRKSRIFHINCAPIWLDRMLGDRMAPFFPQEVNSPFYSKLIASSLSLQLWLGAMAPLYGLLWWKSRMNLFSQRTSTGQDVGSSYLSGLITPSGQHDEFTSPFLPFLSISSFSSYTGSGQWGLVTPLFPLLKQIRNISRWQRLLSPPGFQCTYPCFHKTYCKHFFPLNKYACGFWVVQLVILNHIVYCCQKISYSSATESALLNAWGEGL